jgi:hypothetical protein
MKSIGRYSAAEVSDRVAQRVLELAKGPYARIVSQGKCEPLSGSEIWCGPATIVTGSGEVRVGYLSAIKALGGFYLRWLYVLFLIISPSVKRGWQGGCTVVLGTDYSTVFRKGGVSSFIDFCRTGPIKPLSSAAVTIVQAENMNKNYSQDDFVFSPRPLAVLLNGINIKFVDRIKMLFCHVQVLLAYSFLCLKITEASLIAKEVCFVAPISELDRLGRIDSFVLSCTLFNSQHLWMRSGIHFRIHMVWYAQNFKPVTWTDNQITSDLVEFRAMHVNEHWVWTKSFGEYLLGFVGNVKYTAVGPILWYLPQIDLTSSDKLQIAIFDVSPYSDEIALSYGQFPNYNSPANLTQFISDILALKDFLTQNLQRELVCVLKTKRGYRSAYDREYFEMLESKSAEGVLKLIPHDEDIFRIIGGSSLVIVYPFSSPAYVAEAMGVPVIYYDPTGNIIGHYFPQVIQKIGFVSGKYNLLKCGLEKLIN